MIEESIAEKQCLGCRRLKPLNGYAPDSRRKDGLKSRCIDCTRQYRQYLRGNNVAEHACSRCGVTKPVEDFVKNRNSPTLRTTYCLECQATYSREHRLTEKGQASVKRAKDKKLWTDPVRKERHRHTRFLREYGITLEDYDRLLADQKGVCAICGQPNRNPKIRLSVDHNHFEPHGAVRGLLCSLCNRAIGLFNDSPETAQRAVDYLLKHRQLKLVI